MREVAVQAIDATRLEPLIERYARLFAQVAPGAATAAAAAAAQPFVGPPV